MGKLKIYIFLFVLLIGLLFVVESNKPKPIDWTPSFNRNHKKPWGTYILFKELKNIFPDTKIEVIKKTPYELLRYKYYSKNESKKAYILLNNYLDIDKKSFEKLLEFAKKGNTVFMAATSIPKFIRDTLHFKTRDSYFYSYKDSAKKEMYLTNKYLKQEKFIYNKGFKSVYFDSLPTSTATILGYHNYKKKDFINYAKIQFGKGEFYIHLQPYTFTNYHLLKENHYKYVTNALSYIDVDKIYWDSKIKADLDISDNKLRYILKQPALKWAWRLSWIGIIIFIIFRAKRKQRIVPIIKKLPNTSIAFAKTIGNMYFNQGKPKDIINKKITFFLEYIRNTYLLDTQNLNDEFRKRLYHKTGVPKDEINRLINYIIELQKRDEPQEYALVTLNKLIEKFYKKTKM